MHIRRKAHKDVKCLERDRGRRVIAVLIATSMAVIFGHTFGFWTAGAGLQRTFAAHRTKEESPKSASGYTFWSSDFHVSPIADLKHLFQPMGMTIIDKSLSGHCHLQQTCAKDLKVITSKNGVDFGNCPNHLRRDFFDTYKNDREMQTVDAFLCHHACGMCELFMPFNKSLIVVASTRYEIGRHSPKRWTVWNENLRKIAANPRNIVAANNVYDMEYIKYFTGIQNVQLLPNFCGYTKAVYDSSKPQILVGPAGRGIPDKLFEGLKQQGTAAGLTFARVRDLYPQFQYSDLTQHRAIVLIPYQVSIMSIFEYYNMAIPLFAPSLELLTKWHFEHRLLGERTWEGAYGHLSAKSAIPPHPNTTVPFDPNNDQDEEAFKYWVKFADFYVWPHIQTFDSWDDLISKLQSANLTATSLAMQAHNANVLINLTETWQGHFRRMFAGLPPAAQQPRVQEQGFDKALLHAYGISVSGCDDQSSVAA